MNKKPTQWRRRLALQDADPNLAAPSVLSTICIVPELARRIEPVGKFYAALQHRRMFGVKEEEEEKVPGSEKSRSEDDDEEEAKTHNFEHKKNKRTKEEIDAEALL